MYFTRVSCVILGNFVMLRVGSGIWRSRLGILIGINGVNFLLEDGGKVQYPKRCFK
jgi:hypothetical protein